MSSSPDKLYRILDLARWSPSGDNTQPWQFEVLDAQRFLIHGRDTRKDCVYDLDGRASQLSLGALIETIDIAASAFGMTAQMTRRQDASQSNPTFDVSLLLDSTRQRSRLVSEIPARSVNRRAFSLRAIGDADRQTLALAVGPDHDLLWYSSIADRLHWALLLWSNAGLRLRLPEAFAVHKRVIEWRARYSPDRIPDQALGASTATLLIMRQAMTSWHRVNFLNTWLGGTLGPRLEMDLIPALACGAHIAIVAKQALRGLDDHVAGGRAVQRFWLTATRLGLQHQPSVTPLVFSRYAREQTTFTDTATLTIEAEKLQLRLSELLQTGADRAIWLGRLGHGASPSARSQRKELSQLMV
jgi:nitroreductase